LHVNKNRREAVVVELNTETDFVAQNEKFQLLLGDIVLAASRRSGDSLTVETLLQEPGTINTSRLSDTLADAVNSLRENIQLTRVSVFKSDFIIGSYMHQVVQQAQVPAEVLMGRIGCLVGIKPTGDTMDDDKRAKLESFANTMAMHCAAAFPKYLSPETVPAEALEAEKKLLKEQVALSGKGLDKADAIVAGRLKKFYEDNCLTMQTLLVTESQEPISKITKELGCECSGFLRYQVGEALS